MSAVVRYPVTLDLSEGSRLVLDGDEWEVTCFQPHLGRVKLQVTTGAREGLQQDVTVRALLNHPDCRPSTNVKRLPASSRGGQPAGVGDLTDAQRDIVAARYAHLMKAETGFRSGARHRALPGEPRPGYDPETTTLTQRRVAKAAELRALPDADAAMLGLKQISIRTLERWAGAVRRFGPAGLINGSWVRRGGGHPAIVPEVREAIFAVRQETLHRSRVSMKTKDGMIRQYVARSFNSAC